jgi:hypothetical protein
MPLEVVTVAVEGTADVAVVQRVLESVPLALGGVYVLNGKGRLDQRIADYNHASRYTRWLVLRDLDQDAACAPALVQRLLPQPAPHMCLRIAVRATEAWLLADRERLSRFLGVARNVIPLDPEKMVNPKQALVNLARKSHQRAVREDLVPAPGTTAQVGPGYTARLIEFASQLWRPDVAAQQSDSLRRCLAALRKAAST